MKSIKLQHFATPAIAIALVLGAAAIDRALEELRASRPDATKCRKALDDLKAAMTRVGGAASCAAASRVRPCRPF